MRNVSALVSHASVFAWYLSNSPSMASGFDKCLKLDMASMFTTSVTLRNKNTPKTNWLFVSNLNLLNIFFNNDFQQSPVKLFPSSTRPFKSTEYQHSAFCCIKINLSHWTYQEFDLNNRLILTTNWAYWDWFITNVQTCCHTNKSIHVCSF